MLRVTETVSIAERELEERFIRASGPGGQNVNKVATAVELRFDVRQSGALAEPVRRRLERLAGRRMTEDGVLVIRAERFRTQDRNRADARARLVALVRQALVGPKRRIATRPTAASVRRRAEAKRHRAKVKRLRRAKPAPD
ncbi:MAG TPA: alternative ribosome rescue aminoacyl-tRNA hydrolase ArfB [Hyphomicrobiaceae bacterium]|nr:alternative ribosome rescue aminoacyl-tRNA hydrolase ArfB [Hyphomicrobiaceae bacterium]